MTTRIWTLMFALFAFGAAGVDVVAQEKGAAKETEATLKKRMAGRLSALKKLRAAGKVGETWKGTVAATPDTDVSQKVTLKKKGADPEVTTLGALLKAENADRRASYELLAEKRSTDDQVVTADYVGVQSAKSLARRAKPGEWLQVKSGKWVQKPKSKGG